MNEYIVTKQNGQIETIAAKFWEYDYLNSKSCVIFYSDLDKKCPIAYISRVKSVVENNMEYSK